jgi:hypothetical protein
MAISVGQFTTVNSLASTSGSVNISAPAGIVANDLLLMFVISTSSTSYSSTGWTTYTSDSATSSNPVYYTILYKVANSSDVSLSSSSGSYTITTPTETVWTTASILRIAGAKTSSPFTVSNKTPPAVDYDYILSGIDYITQKSGCLLIAFCGSSRQPFTGFPNGTGSFASSSLKQNTGFSNILSMGYSTGGSASNSLHGRIAYQTVPLYTNLVEKPAHFSSYSNTSTKVGLQILIEPFTLPKYLMRELYDANGNPYANGTPVYCASETTPTSVITGAVGSWVGNESTYLTQNVALPYGGVGFGFDAPDTDRKFIYIKPSVDEYGLISEYITPTQL